MENQNEQFSGSNATPEQSGREVRFDVTTNFSLLGWLWDKFNRAGSSKKSIDLSLEE
ncbi:hypothetical protein D1BOALGB6SA_4772 [Olavius sp. associated proteobacterium Delta 1]|nr:hypothetical protein D1BOALGB6SA_4772 [Olavius sp. associated proteobacterium Delta 1]